MQSWVISFTETFKQKCQNIQDPKLKLDILATIEMLKQLDNPKSMGGSNGSSWAYYVNHKYFLIVCLDESTKQLIIKDLSQ